ncbi:MAG: hypothetical protein Q8P86_03345 [bacterium]|nr:hypothetical protein [bacterium]
MSNKKAALLCKSRAVRHPEMAYSPQERPNRTSWWQWTVEQTLGASVAQLNGARFRPGEVGLRRDVVTSACDEVGLFLADISLQTIGERLRSDNQMLPAKTCKMIHFYNFFVNFLYSSTTNKGSRGIGKSQKDA